MSIRSMPKNSVTRIDFIKSFMSQCGMPYPEAIAAYDSMISVFEDAVVSGSKINIGNIGSLTPQLREARVVNMGFSRDATGVKKSNRQYYLGKRLRYRFTLFKKFIFTHSLNWNI